MTTTHVGAAPAALPSPVEEEKRFVPVQSTGTFLAVLLGVTPVFAVTVLPLTLLYRLGRAAAAPLLRALRQPREPPALDSGYAVEAGQAVPRPQRRYDVVVLGATGFTGRLAARHLAMTYGCDGRRGVRWAMAGRSREKLERVRAEMAQQWGMTEIEGIDLIVADTAVPATLPALVGQTRVVATTAGPYARYGSSVVEFCAKFGTHYVDITGEVDWVKAMAAQWGDVARRTGAKLISFCGHDSIPWDLSVMKLQSILQKECGDNLVRATFWDESVGGAPGGTFATALNAIEGVPVQAPKTDFDPFLRAPDGSKSDFVATARLPLVISKLRSPWDGASSKRWSMPFVMAPINAEVVRWSHALRREGSKSLTYTESMVLPDFKTAFIAYSGLIMLGVSLLNPLTRYLFKKVIPAPGEGPNMKDMEEKHYLCVFGEGVGERGNRVESVMYFPQDPGCLETARMMVESGLCLALQESSLPVADGGFWTPSTGLGDVLDQRLRNVGMRWSSRVLPCKE